jgi:predicted Zn-dependent protease
VAARAVVAVVAVLLIAWLAVTERDERLLQRGAQIAGHARGMRDAARAEQAFRDARLLNPDSTPDLARAYIYIGTSRNQQAVDLIDELVRREPDNLTAWALLFRVSRGVDPASERRALAQRRRLDPLSIRQ